MVTTRMPVRGMSTLELLLAFAILTLSLTAVISLLYGNQAVGVDTRTATEALARAQKMAESERALASSNYLAASSTSSTETVGSLTYTETETVTDITPCAKIATSTISWNAGTLRPQKIELATLLTDVAGALAAGGDCATQPPTSGWTNPQRFASDTFNPGKPLALDALDRIVYIGEDQSPFLKIADARHATLGQTSGLFVSYTNGFDAGTAINSVDAINWTNPSTGAKKVYVYAALDSKTTQLEVIDATVPTAPVVASTVSLSSCVKGSFPQGWFVAAYGNRLYMVTRETAGPELHIFDISTPSAPVELSVGSASCKGYELTDTTEQLSVRDQKVNGVTKRFLYLATDEGNQELRVLDVTNPLAISQVTNIDLTNVEDAQSVYLVGTKLYLGRQSVPNTQPEFFVYDVSNPYNGLTLLGSTDVGTDVLGIRVNGPLAFLATGKANQELQIWNVSDPTHMTRITSYNFGNIVGNCLDYEPDYLYACSQATPNLQILYSP